VDELEERVRAAEVDLIEAFELWSRDIWRRNVEKCLRDLH